MKFRSFTTQNNSGNAKRISPMWRGIFINHLAVGCTIEELSNMFESRNIENNYETHFDGHMELRNQENLVEMELGKTTQDYEMTT